MGRITRDRVERGAEACAARMLRWHERTYGPAPKSATPVDAPYTTNSEEPSYYGKGTLTVVSTAGRVRASEGREWEWEVGRVTEAEAAEQGVPWCPALAEDGKLRVIRRGDWSWWEVDTGQRDQACGIVRGWEWIDGTWTPLLNGAAHTQVHHTKPIVLTHLEPRDIVCESYAQAEAECARVGKYIAR